MTVLVTGASSGLGAALARRYAGPGTRLALTGRDPDRLEAVAEDCRALGAEVQTGVLDVRDAEALMGWIAAVDARAPIETAIANAGVSAGPPKDGRSEGYASAARQIETNLLGTVATVEAVLPGFLKRGRGRIGVISSIAGLRGLPYRTGYSASKAGSRAYGEALRALVRPAGISVSVICPGFFVSPMTERWKGDTPFLRTVDRVAADAKRCIDKGRSRQAWPLPLVVGLRAADIGPPLITDWFMRGFKFHIVPPERWC